MFDKIMSMFGGNLLGGASDLIDKLVTDKGEKAALNIEMQALIQAGTQQARDAVAKENEELTKRHQADMNSDSTLAKVIRPATLIFLMIVYVLFAVTDGNLAFGDFAFNVADNYVLMLGEWTKNVMFFYFGGRSIEKVAPHVVQMFNKKK